MGGATENQIKFLTKNGYADALNYTYEHASKLIGQIKGVLPTTTPKWNQPQPASSPLPVKEYHLTAEECNARALESAIEVLKSPENVDFKKILMQFKHFIETGEF